MQAPEDPQAMRDFVRATHDDVGNVPPLPGVFPDYSAPIGLQSRPGGSETAWSPIEPAEREVFEGEQVVGAHPDNHPNRMRRST